MNSMLWKVTEIIATGINNDDLSSSIAKAAIAAMREPTEEMMEAFSNAGSNIYSNAENDYEIWQAGVDAALKE